MTPKKLPVKRLNNGSSIPMLAFGTGSAHYKASNLDSIDSATVSHISNALCLGYIHLDGAEMYNTEPEIGVAIKESGIPRSQLYIVTKVIKNIANIAAGLDASLYKLGLEYVDLYLIHSPAFAKYYGDSNHKDLHLLTSSHAIMAAELVWRVSTQIVTHNHISLEGSSFDEFVPKSAGYPSTAVENGTTTVKARFQRKVKKPSTR